MSSKKRRSRSGRRHSKEKSQRLLVAAAVIAVALIFGAGYLKTRMSPEDNVKKTAGSDRDTKTDKPEVSEEPEELGDVTVWEGKTYEIRRKQDLVLFLGVDRSAEKAAKYEEAGENGIAETILVLAADREKQEIRLLEIPADTMIEAQLYDASGNYTGTAEMPAGLQFSYGKSARDGCRLVSERISEILLGQKIDGTISLTSDGLKEVVDNLGGVDISIPEDVTGMESVDPSFVAGQTVHMDGALAARFIMSGSSDSSLGKRQLAFLKALYHKSGSGSNVAEFLNQAAQKEMYNGVDLETLVNLFTCSVNDEILALPGERAGEDGTSGFRTDHERMMELVLGLFYEETEGEN